MQVIIDKIYPQIMINGICLSFTRREFDLFVFLWENKGKICTRQLIREIVWGSNYLTNDRSIDMVIGRIRKKLGKQFNSKLVTKKGFGYLIIN